MSYSTAKMRARLRIAEGNAEFWKTEAVAGRELQRQRIVLTHDFSRTFPDAPESLQTVAQTLGIEDAERLCYDIRLDQDLRIPWHISVERGINELLRASVLKRQLPIRVEIREKYFSSLVSITLHGCRVPESGEGR